MTRLRPAQLQAPGIRRVKSGRGFRFVGPGDRKPSVSSLKRAKSLAIPPAWTEVWVCPDPAGHIQAVGQDQAGRRQYIYHPDWVEARTADKHARVVRLARQLPEARLLVSESMAERRLSREQVLAAAIKLLHLGFFRIGSEQYAVRHGTYGLATLLRDDVKVRGSAITFEFVGKHGIHVERRIIDPSLASLVRSLKRRDDPNPELLAWRTGHSWHDVNSRDINHFVQELFGEEFTAKDFRTWHGTVLAAAALSLSSPKGLTDNRKRQIVVHATREVAHYLGNTPAVARRSYIDHAIIEHFYAGRTISISALEGGADGDGPATHGAVEAETLRLLRRRPRQPK